MKNYMYSIFFYFFILIISINSQITLDFFIDDNLSYEEEEENIHKNNLRSSLEILRKTKKNLKLF